MFNSINKNGRTQVIRLASSVLGLFFLLVSFPAHLAFDQNVSLIMLFASTLFLSIYADGKNIFHISFLSGHYAFWVFPIAIATFSGYGVSYFVAFFCLLGSYYALLMTNDKPVFEVKSIFNNIPAYYFFIIYMCCVALLIFTSGKTFVWAIGILTVSGALCMASSGILTSSIIYTSLVSYIIIYYSLYWTGFGRLVVVGALMVTTYMYLIRAKLTFLLKPIIILFIPFGTLLGSSIRTNVTNINELMVISIEDSAVSPILLATDIYNTRGYIDNIDLYGWFDQIMLLFLALFPRSVWPEKPNGFGFQYTLENLPAYMAESGHSIAATFIGENIYYLGSAFGILGMFLSLSLIVLIYKMLSYPKIFSGYGVYVMCLWIPTYYWNGIQSFSERFSFSFVPMVGLLILYQLYVRIKERRDRIKLNNGPPRHPHHGRPLPSRLPGGRAGAQHRPSGGAPRG